jgi:hypothetical protein
MNAKKCVLIVLSCLGLASCSLFEDLENKTYRDQTIELLTKGGTWKVDSLVRWKFTPATGVTDSLFLNYGTMEFQSPDNKDIPFGNHGYMIHKYTKNGKARVDTLAWEPFGAGSRSPDPEPLYGLSIWYEDPNGQPASFTDDLEFSFIFRMKEKNKVNVAGKFSINQPGLTLAEYHYSYHLTR